MISYVEDPKDYTHTHTHTKLLELINKCSKVAGYKINIHKSVIFLYTNNEQFEKEIKTLISFNSTSNSIERKKILGNKKTEIKFQY